MRYKLHEITRSGAIKPVPPSARDRHVSCFGSHRFPVRLPRMVLSREVAGACGRRVHADGLGDGQLVVSAMESGMVAEERKMVPSSRRLIWWGWPGRTTPAASIPSSSVLLSGITR